MEKLRLIIIDHSRRQTKQTEQDDLLRAVACKICLERAWFEMIDTHLT